MADPKLERLHRRRRTLRVRLQKLIDNHAKPWRRRAVRKLLVKVRARINTTEAHRETLAISYRAVGFDGCPVPRVVQLALQDVRDSSSLRFTVISGDRRQGVAERFGHLSQYALWYRYTHGWSGYLPANRPGESTHEFRNGSSSGSGVAFRTLYAPGALLPPESVGIDFASNAEATAFVGRARALGYRAFQPYNTGSELHHVCLYGDVLRNLIDRGLA